MQSSLSRDQENPFTNWNRAMLFAFGYFQAELNDKPWPAIIHSIGKNPDSKPINVKISSLTDMYMFL